jgi:hypothetical protein
MLKTKADKKYRKKDTSSSMKEEGISIKNFFDSFPCLGSFDRSKNQNI